MANEKGTHVPAAPALGNTAEPRAVTLQRAAVVAAEILKGRVVEYERAKLAAAACEKSLEEARAGYLMARDSAAHELGRIAAGGAP